MDGEGWMNEQEKRERKKERKGREEGAPARGPLVRKTDSE